MAARRADDPARTGAPGDRTPCRRPATRRRPAAAPPHRRSVAAALGALLALVALLA
ncbi:hypothetical protein ACFQ1I_35790 [Kitasatospora arboriphila]